MAFNPKTAVPDDKALVRFMKPVPIKKTEYYMEWWRLGEPSESWEAGYFHSAYLKAFVKMFMNLRKFNVLFLQRVHDRTVLWDRRGKR